MILEDVILYNSNFIKNNYIGIEYNGEIYSDSFEEILNIRNIAFICKNIHIDKKTELFKGDIHVLTTTNYGSVLKILIENNISLFFEFQFVNQKVIKLYCMYTTNKIKIRKIKLQNIFNFSDNENEIYDA